MKRILIEKAFVLMASLFLMTPIMLVATAMLLPLEW